MQGIDSQLLLSIESACMRIVHLAARYTDQARWEDLAGLFTDDGQLMRPSDPARPITGRANILASMRSRPARLTVHTVTNLIVEVLSTTSAHVSSIITLYTADAVAAASGDSTPQPVAGSKILIGGYEDDLVRHEHGWAFSRRAGTMSLEFAL